jgi:hypothetical protein
MFAVPMSSRGAGQMSTIIRLTPPGQLPEPKFATKLIVLCAFDKGDEGVLRAAFEPREMPDERRAITTARDMAKRHVGVIAWMRSVNPALGEFGPSEVLYQAGEIPDLD